MAAMAAQEATAASEPPKPLRHERLRPEQLPTVQFLKDLDPLIHPDTAFDQEEGSRPQRTLAERGMLWGLGAAACIAIGVFLMRPTAERTNNTAAEPAPPRPSDLTSPPTASSSTSILSSIKSFSEANSDAVRVQHVLRGREIASQLTEYYSKMPPNYEIQRLRSVILTPLPMDPLDSAVGIAAVRADRPGHPPRVLLLKGQPGDPSAPYLLDWESYVQEMDQSLEQFLAQPNSQPAVFRVKLSRTHSFDSEDPEHTLAISLCSLSGKPLGQNLLLYPGDSYYRRLSDQLKWLTIPLATVKLAWGPSRGSNAGDPPTVILEKFICWEALGVGRSAESHAAPANLQSLANTNER